MFAAQTLNHAR